MLPNHRLAALPCADSHRMEKMRLRRAVASGMTILLLSGMAIAQTITRVSMSSTGVEANGYSNSPHISADGRYACFYSVANNLVAGDTNNVADVFVHDRYTGATVRASVSTTSVESNGDSFWATISADGRYALFGSYGDNLVEGDTNHDVDAFLRDLSAGVTIRVNEGAAFPIVLPRITPDGRYSVFVAPAGPNLTGVVYLYDAETGDAIVAAGYPVWSMSPWVSDDARFIAFHSQAYTADASDTNEASDVFVRDRTTSSTTRVSVSTNGVQGHGHSYDPSLSGDGRFVGFRSSSAELVQVNLPSIPDAAFVHDRVTGQTVLASRSTSGERNNQPCFVVAISSDGRYVVFSTPSDNLVTNDLNGGSDVFVHDRMAGTTTRVSVGPNGVEANGYSAWPSISSDGRFVAFVSGATNLVANDTNGVADVFVIDRGSPSYGPLCFGDGSEVTCPCGNSGAPGRGCANSVNANGAWLVATGTTSPNTLLLTCVGVPNANLCTFLRGTSVVGGFPFGDGVRCVSGTLIRFGSQVSVANEVASGAIALAPGNTRYYQLHYRNPNPAFCPVGGFNISNGLQVSW